MSTFALDISRIANNFGISASMAARKIILDIQGGTMEATPVETGLLRSSWFVGIDTPSAEKSTAPDGGASAKAKAALALAGWKWGQSIYLTNNLVYAVPIEFGHSKVKAPAGMLRVTVARIQSQLGRWS